MPRKYKKLVSEYTGFILTRKSNLRHSNLQPFGIGLEFKDSSDLGNTEFMNILMHLDSEIFGYEENPTTKWLVLAPAILSSAIVGFGKPSGEVSPSLRERLKVGSDYEGLVPLSEHYIIPHLDSEIGVGRRIGSIVTGKHLGEVTAFAGWAACNFKKLVATSQYDNPALRIYTKLGKWRIESAIMPGHSRPYMTFLGSSEIPSEAKLYDILCFHRTPTLEEVLSQATFMLDPYDTRKKKEMHRELSKGTAKYYIVPPGLIEKDGEKFVPIEEN